MSKPLKSLSLFEDFIKTETYPDKVYSLKSMAKTELGMPAIHKGLNTLFQEQGFLEKGLFPGIRLKVDSKTNQAQVLILSNKIGCPKFSTTQEFVGDAGAYFKFKINRIEIIRQSEFLVKESSYELSIAYTILDLDLSDLKSLTQDQWIIACEQKGSLTDAILKQLAVKYGFPVDSSRVENNQNLWDLWLTSLAS